MVYDILQWLIWCTRSNRDQRGPFMITKHVQYVYIVQGLDYLGF